MQSSNIDLVHRKTIPYEIKVKEYCEEGHNLLMYCLHSVSVPWFIMYLDEMLHKQSIIFPN